MSSQHQTPEQIEDLLAQHPELRLEITFSNDGARPLAQMRIFDVRADKFPTVSPERKLARRIISEGLATAAIFFIFFSALSGNPDMWGATLLVGATLSFFIFRSLRIRRTRKSIRALESTISSLHFSAEVSPLWAQVAQEDPETNYLVTQWLFNKRAIRQLGEHIERGALAMKKLPPSDQLQDRMQIEIETLRARLSDARTSLRIDEKSTEEAARRYSDHQQRQQDAELKQKIRAVAETQSAREFEARMRAVGKTEQTRLKAQERAQDWLYGSGN